MYFSHTCSIKLCCATFVGFVMQGHTCKCNVIEIFMTRIGRNVALSLSSEISNELYCIHSILVQSFHKNNYTDLTLNKVIFIQHTVKHHPEAHMDMILFEVFLQSIDLDYTTTDITTALFII